MLEANGKCENLLTQTLEKVTELSLTMAVAVNDIQHMKDDISNNNAMHEKINSITNMMHGMTSGLEVMKRGVESTDEKITKWEESQKEQGGRLGSLEKEVATLKVTERIIWGIVAALLILMGGAVISLLMPADHYYFYGYGG